MRFQFFNSGGEHVHLIRLHIISLEREYSKLVVVKKRNGHWGKKKKKKKTRKIITNTKFPKYGRIDILRYNTQHL